MISLPAGLGFLMPPGGAATTYVSSVQLVEITLASVTSNTATITSVNTTMSFVVFLGNTSSTSGSNSSLNNCRVELTNGTTVTASRNAATGTCIARAIVVECTSSLVNSVQHGTVAITASTTGTASITAVTVGKAAVFYLGESTAGTTTQTGLTRVDLTNSTTITSSVNTSSTATTGFCVVDFNPAAIQSLQTVSTTSTSASTTTSTTITSVNTANILPAYGGQTTASSLSTVSYGQLANATTFTWTRQSVNTSSRTCNVMLIELVAGVLNSSSQTGSTDVNSLASGDTTITSINTNKTAISWLGLNSSATVASQSYQTAKLFSSTVVRCERVTAGTADTVTGWAVAEFK